MAKINTVIPTQKFELIRDKIAFILADELANQAILPGGDPSLADVEVWTERFIPFDKEELPAIKLYFVGSSFEDETPITNAGPFRYYIDIYTKGKKQPGKNGSDYYSAINLHKILGKCLGILQDPNYVRLDFPPSFGIRNRQITDIRIAEPEERKGDGISTYTARITMTVMAVEQFTEIQPVTAEGYDTSIKIGETDKGYKIELNN